MLNLFTSICLCKLQHRSKCLTLQATKTRIKLNPKKLYMADGYSVQEMLKVVTMLYNAVKSNKADAVNEDVTERSFDISNKVLNITLQTQGNIL